MINRMLFAYHRPKTKQKKRKTTFTLSFFRGIVLLLRKGVDAILIIITNNIIKSKHYFWLF